MEPEEGRTGSLVDKDGESLEFVTEECDNKPLNRILQHDGIKTLSPRPDLGSPIKETDSSWTVIHTMFVKDDEEGMFILLDVFFLVDFF